MELWRVLKDQNSASQHVLWSQAQRALLCVCSLSYTCSCLRFAICLCFISKLVSAPVMSLVRSPCVSTCSVFCPVSLYPALSLSHGLYCACFRCTSWCFLSIEYPSYRLELTTYSDDDSWITLDKSRTKRTDLNPAFTRSTRQTFIEHCAEYQTRKSQIPAYYPLFVSLIFVPFFLHLQHLLISKSERQRICHVKSFS